MLRYKDFAVIIIATIAAAMFLKAYVLDAVLIPSSSMQKTLLPGDFVLVNKINFSNNGFTSGAPLTATIPFVSRLMPASIQRGDVIVFKFPAASRKTLLNENDLLVKRCIGKSGDIVQIQRRKIFINGLPVARVNEYSTVDRAPDDFFPPNSDFSFQQYGPLRIPKQGDIIHLTKETFPVWEQFIKREGRAVSWSDEQGAIIDGNPEQVYIVQKNYLFVLGDNFYKSYDSRFWGFLPEDYVIGTAAFVYWSVETERTSQSITGIFDSIRWGRIGTIVQ